MKWRKAHKNKARWLKPRTDDAVKPIDFDWEPNCWIMRPEIYKELRRKGIIK